MDTGQYILPIFRPSFDFPLCSFVILRNGRIFPQLLHRIFEDIDNVRMDVKILERAIAVQHHHCSNIGLDTWK